jgi:hypothetical protein
MVVFVLPLGFVERFVENELSFKKSFGYSTPLLFAIHYAFSHQRFRSTRIANQDHVVVIAKSAFAIKRIIFSECFPLFNVNEFLFSNKRLTSPCSPVSEERTKCKAHHLC